MPKKLIVRIETDPDLENPSAAGNMDSCWRIWSFCSRHYNFKDPDELGFHADGSCDDSELAAKLESGLAFRLGYYEHGQSLWFLKGNAPPGADCPWDGVSFAGVAIWEEPEDHMGHKTYETRADCCARFLKDYTAWCNGEGYWYCVETEDGEEITSCGGFYGSDPEDMFAEIRAETRGDEVMEVVGDAAWLADYHAVQDVPEDVAILRHNT